MWDSSLSPGSAPRSPQWVSLPPTFPTPFLPHWTLLSSEASPRATEVRGGNEGPSGTRLRPGGHLSRAASPDQGREAEDPSHPAWAPSEGAAPLLGPAATQHQDTQFQQRVGEDQGMGCQHVLRGELEPHSWEP